MKSYYEIESKQKQDLLCEFNKTPGGKEINKRNYIFSIFWFCLMIISIITGEIYIDFYYDALFKLSHYFEQLSLMFFVLYIAGLAYKRFAFRGYIKTKHKIQ